MKNTQRSLSGDAVSNLILDLFKLTGKMLAAGDKLVADLGLTSARWQVLGAIVAAERPQPVAWLARDLGAHRQNIQRIVNDLAEQGLVALAANPHHRRAHLIVLTDSGKQAFEAAMQFQAPWISHLSQGLSVADIQTTHKVLIALRKTLEANEEVCA